RVWRRGLPGTRRQPDMSVTEQSRDVSGRVRAHHPIGAAMLETHILQPVEIAQQFLPFRRGARFTQEVTLLHGGFARRVLTSRRLRSCYSSEYRTPELVHPVEGLDGN